MGKREVEREWEWKQSMRRGGRKRQKRTGEERGRESMRNEWGVREERDTRTT